MRLINIHLQRLGFRRQLTIMVTAAIVSLAIVSTLVNTLAASRHVKSHLVEAGERVTENLAHQSTLALLYHAPDNADNAMATALSFPDVRTVEIRDTAGRLLLRRTNAGAPAPSNAPADATLGAGPAKVTETGTDWTFTAPVHVQNDATADSPFDLAKPQAQTLGYVRVVLGKATLERLLTSLLVANLSITFTIAAALLLLLGVLTRQIATPLGELSGLMRRAENGESGMRAQPNGPRDIAAMAQAFNEMMHVLEEREDLLTQSRDEAVRAVEAKSAFLANMSHEIRTPMNAVLGMLALLKRTALTPRQADYALKTEGAARGLLGLLNDILDFSKIEAGKLTLDPQPFQLDPLLRQLSVILSASAGNKDIEVLFDIDPSLPRSLVGDVTRLRQILINLGGNAVKFTERGEVVVSVTEIGRDVGEVTLEIAVRDTGIGIARANHERIFSGFTQAEASTVRRFGGTGLGVAICQRMIRLMGSELLLESELGRGSRFHFTLTLPVAAEEVGRESAAVTVPEGSRLRVLIVDDNPTASSVLQRMASSLGWQADLADSGERGLELLRASPGTYGAICVDSSMPGLDGWQTCQRIRLESLAGAAPLVVMVASGEQERVARRSEADQQVLDGFVVKPLTASMLHDAIADAAGPEARRSDLVAEAGKHPCRLAGLRLLVAEDNANNQQIARELLEAEGAEVRIADNGLAAIAAVGDADPQFDAVLMDLQMPIMDGYAAAVWIRQSLTSHVLPIIAITANATTADREACLAAGMNDHVGKPFDLDDLVQVLRRHTGREAARDVQGYRASPHTTLTELTAQAVGVDLSRAIARMSGKADVYAGILETFVKDLRILPHQLHGFVDSCRFDEAARLMHALKGLAGTVGHVALATQAANAEAEFNAMHRDDSAAANTLCARLSWAMDQASVDLTTLLDALQVERPAQAIGSPELDRGALLDALLGLAVALRASDMEATALMAGLRQRFGPALGDRLQPLDEAVTALEFTTAMVHSAALAEEYST